MRQKRSTEADLLAELKKMSDRRGGLTETATRLGLSVQFISDVVYGRRRVSEKIAVRMGYRRVVEYERVEQQ